MDINKCIDNNINKYTSNKKYIPQNVNELKYICKRCGYITEHKCSLRNHLNRKKICAPLISDINIEVLLEQLEKKIDCTLCKICGKKLANRQNKRRHEKICEKNQVITNLNIDQDKYNTIRNLIKNKREEIENLLKELDKFLDIEKEMTKVKNK